jgi:hypothetical protein
MFKDITDEELRKLPLISGGDEVPPKEGEEGEEETPEAKALAAKDTELEALKSKNSEYERMVLSDDYLQFLASQKHSQPAAQPQDEGQDVTEEELENMSKKDLVNLILSNVGTMLQQTVSREITPLKQDISQEKFTAQVSAANEKYEDFMSLRDKMIPIATAHPTLNAEQVYKLAGGTGKLRSKETPSAPPGGPIKPKPVRIAIPVASGPMSKKFVPVRTVEAAAKAYDNIFGKEE